MQKVFIIGITGAVASGKSTLANAMANRLRSRFGNAADIFNVTTDNFLYPNEKLEKMGIINKKGAPHTHNEKALREFIVDLRKSSIPISENLLPKYSHTQYNIIGLQKMVDLGGEPKNITSAVFSEIVNYEKSVILILEGVGVSIVRDLLDAYIFYDVNIDKVYSRYINRTLEAWRLGVNEPSSWYYQFRELSQTEFISRAKSVWKAVNEANYYDYILPEREKADYIFK